MPPYVSGPPRSSRLTNWLRSWFPALMWAVLIFTLSGAAFARVNTGPWVEACVRTVWPSAPRSVVERANTAARKGAHVVEYFVLAILITRGLRESSRAPAARLAMVALLLSILYAGADEAHQSLVHGRTARLADCGWDAFGAGLGALLLWWRASRREGEEGEPPASAGTYTDRGDESWNTADRPRRRAASS